MRTSSLKIAGIVLVAAFIFACSQGELDRARVSELVGKERKFSETVSALRILDQGLERGRYEAGELEGLWKTSIGRDFYKRYSLTPLGREHFAHDFSIAEPASLAKPARRVVVEVTGITTPAVGGEALRIARFAWRYDGLTPVVARYTGELGVTHQGEAAFQLFDDGWRLVELDLNEMQNRVPFAWTPELEARLQEQQEATRLREGQALELATAAMLAREPALIFTPSPGWNIPSRHGLTGEALNEANVARFVEVLKQSGVESRGVRASGGYFRVDELVPPSSWGEFERRPRTAGGSKTYALFRKHDVVLSEFSGGNGDSARGVIQISYSEPTPPWQLTLQLGELPNFDYGGKAYQKILWGEPQWGRTREASPGSQIYVDSATALFSKGRDGAWAVRLQ